MRKTKLAVASSAASAKSVLRGDISVQIGVDILNSARGQELITSKLNELSAGLSEKPTGEY